MKRLSLIIAGLCLIFSCSKDKDTSSNPTPTPTPTSCRIISSDKAGVNQFTVSYDSQGRISKYVVFSGSTSIGYFTYTFQYQAGTNKLFIGIPGTTDLSEAEMNSSGNVTKITNPSSSANPGVTSIEYNSSGYITKIATSSSIQEFSYSGGDLVREKLFLLDSISPTQTAFVLNTTNDFEYSDNTVYKLVPPDLLSTENIYAINFIPFLFQNKTNRKIPSRVVSSSSTVNNNVQIKDGSLPKTVNSVTYSYENCN